MKQYLITEKELNNVFGWGIDGEDFEYDKFMETLKPVEDLQINKQREMAEFIKKHQNLRIKLNDYVKKIIELEDKIQQLEKDITEIEKVSDIRWKENTEFKTANKEFTEDYKLQQKAINTLNDSGLELMEENKDLKSKLANQKYLDPQEVKKIFLDCREKPDINIPQFHINAGKAITAICNLAYDKNKITAILVGKILESNKDAVAIADEIIKELGGK